MNESKKLSTRDLSMRLGSLAVIALGMSMSGGNAGCSSADDDPDSPNCVSSREQFASQVYGKALQSCAGCHSPGGTADQKGAKFKIFRDTYPDFVSANLSSMREYAKLEAEGTPIMLQKPLGKRDHGGGVVLKSDSDEYKLLTQFVDDLRAGKEKLCNNNQALGVQYLDNRETLRKAALMLASRFPTPDEFAQAASGEPALDALIGKFTEEEPFYDRLRETWNDALLTDRGLDAGVGANFDNAPQLYDDKYAGYTPENRTWATISVTQEPMRFIDYVVRNNLPFSDVVAGNYVVANPYTAKLYALPHEKPMTPESFLEWKRIDFSPVQNYVEAGAQKTVGVPVSGVLTTPAFINRWETTRTNKGRKRARIVLKNFLATDIFKFAQRPVDSTALTSVQNPTTNSPMCSVCHSVIDPIAGGFRGFDEDRMSRFNADDKWHDDMVPPGINGAQMPPQSYGNALMWLGAQIPNDPRFGISVAQVMYRGLVGDEPLGFPQDRASADYNDQVKAYNAQNDWFLKVGRDFASAKFDLRKLVVAIVKSAYFRAKSGGGDRDGLHAGLGQGSLLSPEMLGRKYRATTGLYFFAGEPIYKDESRMRDGYRRSDLILDRDWRLVYGGIDSGDVTKRSETMSPIMLATSQYTASIVACRSTSYDFSKPLAERRLFPNVEMSTVPFTPRANRDVGLVAVAENETKIRENIKHLFWRLLGETVEANSEQVNKVYTLFTDVWKDLEETELTKGSNKGLGNGRCIADIDYDKPVTFEPKDGRLQAVYPRLAERPDKAPYEPGMRIDRDDNFTVRSWQAVTTYMLMDYKFSHE
jgi:hypothetical protein